MPEILEFVRRRSALVTPGVAETVVRHLPGWKLRFSQIHQPLFPHLVRQLEFLADAVEDVAEGVYKDLPYVAFAQAIAALLYAHDKVGIIPDFIPVLNHADQSSVARAVLIQNERAFAAYASTRGLDWTTITSDL